MGAEPKIDFSFHLLIGLVLLCSTQLEELKRAEMGKWVASGIISAIRRRAALRGSERGNDELSC